MSEHPCKPCSYDYETLNQEAEKLGLLPTEVINCDHLRGRLKVLEIRANDTTCPTADPLVIRIRFTEFGAALFDGKPSFRWLPEGSFLGLPNDEEPLVMIRVNGTSLDIKRRAGVFLETSGANEPSSLRESIPARAAIINALEGKKDAAFAAGEAAFAAAKAAQERVEREHAFKERQIEEQLQREQTERIKAAVSAVLSGEPLLFQNIDFDGTLRTPIFDLLTSAEDTAALRILDFPICGASFAIANDVLVLFEKPWSFYDTDFKKFVLVAPNSSFHVFPNLICHFDGEILEVKHRKGRSFRVDIGFTSCFQADVFRKRVREFDFTADTSEEEDEDKAPEPSAMNRLWGAAGALFDRLRKNED